ncbi:MAG: dTMP kinase [Candidatus Woesearchaeota archaeon]
MAIDDTIESFVPQWETAGKKYGGLLINFEGPEGCGKSTQIERVYNTFKQHFSYLEKEYGCSTMLTKEPGARQSDFLTAGRKLVFFGNQDPKIMAEVENLSSAARLFYMLLDRKVHCDNYIVPELKKGGIVFTDRYIDSSMAYQGYAGGLPREWIDQQNRIATGGLLPDITVLIDVDYDTGLKRQTGRKKDIFESLPRSFHENMRNGYLDMARREPNRFMVIDGSKGIDEVTRDILFNLYTNSRMRDYALKHISQESVQGLMESSEKLKH